MYYCKVGDQFLEAPRAPEELVVSRLGDFGRRVADEVGHLLPVSLDSFVEMYRGPKRLIYRRAADSLLVSPVTKQDAISKSFVKLEKGKPGKAPRCIQPRDPRYNAALGVYIKPIEHRCYKAIQSVFGSSSPVVAKGYNVAQVGAIIADKFHSFLEPAAIGLDAVKFDMHVSDTMLTGFEHPIYRRIFGQCPELAKLLDWQVNNVGRGYCPDGKLKYRVRGKRFSGDMNTALGNCLIACGLVHSYAAERGIRVELINNGDDCVVFLEARDVAGFMVGFDQWFLELGFRMTVEDPVYELERVEFCQMNPVVVAGEVRMVRNPRTSMEKDAMCTHASRPSDVLGWLTSVGMCGMALGSGVPIIQEYYSWMVRHGGKANGVFDHERKGMHYLAGGMVPRWETVSDETRYSFWLAFGILPDAQIAIEEYYRSLEFSLEDRLARSDAPLPLDAIRF